MMSLTLPLLLSVAMLTVIFFQDSAEKYEIQFDYVLSMRGVNSNLFVY